LKQVADIFMKLTENLPGLSVSGLTLSKLTKLFIAVVFSSFLVACDSNDDLDLHAPSLSITSPVPGTAITIDPAISISGEVSSDTTLVEATLNDVDVPAGNISLTGTTFTIDVTLADNANTVVVTASDFQGNSRSLTFTLFYPMLSIPDGASASLVLGQPSYTVNDPNQNIGVGASTLSGVQGTLFKRNNSVLYVPDSGNHRVLGFNSTTSEFNEGADFVVGQADLTSADSGVSPTRFTTPTGVYTTDTQFFVVDQGNNRVLIWDSIPSSGSVEASTVIGQADLTTGTSGGCTDSGLNMPSSVFVVDGKVVVSDTGNNRVLIWNTIPDTNGASADIVIGQTDMITCLSNGAGGVVANNTLSSPGGIWTDGVRLLVADTANHRVLVWDDISTVTSGQAADWVLGQVNKTSAAVVSPPTDSSLNGPLSVSSNGNQIFVADTGNNRVLGWDSFPAADGPPATTVIGQADFTSTTTGISASEMTTYDNVFVAREGVYVVDSHRILRFSEP
jgi:hypothetical protein